MFQQDGEREKTKADGGENGGNVFSFSLNVEVQLKNAANKET
jgi:hypothetical protein